jgi:ribose-phosphate pyrophosphokinase
MELLLTVTAARRSGASKVIAIVPYFGYRHHRRGLPISTTYSSRFLWSASGDLAKMLQVVGVDSVVSVDLQRPGQGHEACFFDSQIPVETVSTNSLFVEYFKNVNLTEPVVIISPNPECVKKAKKFQEKLKLATGIEKIDYGVFLHDLDSATADTFTSTSLDLLGDVNGASVIIVEEVIDANYPILPLCNLLREQGAKRIIICASHGLFTPESCKVIEDSPIEKIVISDSIELPDAANAPLNKVISFFYLLLLIITILSKDITGINSSTH